jgi:hypothetical protein
MPHAKSTGRKQEEEKKGKPPQKVMCAEIGSHA